MGLKSLGRARRGFTLIEAMMSAVVGAVVMLSVLSVMQISTKSKLHLESQLKSTQTSSAGLKLLRTELESAGSKFPNALWAVKVLNNVKEGGNPPWGVAVTAQTPLEVNSSSMQLEVSLKPNTDMIDIAIGDENSVPGTILTALKTAPLPQFVMNTPDPFDASFYTAGLKGIALFQNRDGQGCVAIVKGGVQSGSNVLEVQSFLDHHFDESADLSVRAKFGFDWSASSGNDKSEGARAFAVTPNFNPLIPIPGLKNRSYQNYPPPAVQGGCPNDDIIGGERMAVYKLARRRRFGVFHYTTGAPQNVTDGSGNGNSFLGVIESVPNSIYSELNGPAVANVRMLVPNVVDLEISPRIQVNARRKTSIPFSDAEPLNLNCTFNGKDCKKDCAKGTCLINGPNTAISFDPDIGTTSFFTNFYPGGSTTVNGATALARMWAMQVGLDITLITRGDSLKGDERSFDTSYKDFIDPAITTAKEEALFGKRDAATCAKPATAALETACGMTKYPLSIETTSIAMRNLRMTTR